MRYQEYKNKMLKIRRVIDFFYRFRFAFAGAVAAIIAGSITLDVTRGNITETSEFKMAYTYGEEIQCSGSAFMSKVTYEFRKKGDTNWSEETPIYPGQYEARAKSNGSHGYKYSDEKSFVINPYPTTFSLKDTSINFGDDSPELAYNLLPGDRLDDDYIVEYADKTVKETKATIKLDSLRIYNSKNVDVTSCYEILAKEADITFVPQPLTFTFRNPGSFTYTGDESHPFTADDYDFNGSLFYGAQPVISGGVSRTAIGTEANHHSVAIKDAQGNDYTANYDIKIKDNSITVNKAPAIYITSSTLKKTYDGQPFEESKFTYNVTGLLTNVHQITDVVFLNKDVSTCDEANNIQNSFTYKIIDKRTGDQINPLDYYSAVNLNYGSITIDKVKLTINTPTKNHNFDNKDVKGYEEGDLDYTGTLVGDDFIKVDYYPTEHVPGKFSNDYLCNVYRRMMVSGVLQDVDVTSNYDIRYNYGYIEIKPVPIVIKFDGQDIEYDAQPHNVYKNSNQGYIISGSLPTGWTYSSVVYGNTASYEPYNMEQVLANEGYYTATEQQVVTNIWDEYGNPMTAYYVIDNVTDHNNDSNCDVTFVFEQSKITKADLSITITDFDPIEYNHMTIGENFDLSSRVSSVGLKGDDEIVVSYSNDNQRLIRNASTTPYQVGLNIEVVNSSGTPTGGNYNIEYNREPTYTTVQINKKSVKIHTPDLQMVYNGTTTIPNEVIDFSGVKVYDEDNNVIDELAVAFNKNKTYSALDPNKGTQTYTCFEEADLIIIDKYTGVIYQQSGMDNYDIDLIEDGQLEIIPRVIEIYQVDDESKDHIFYDGNYHGVFNGSREVKYTLDTGDPDSGLITKPLHVLNFNHSRNYVAANEDGHPRLLGDGVADKVAYFDVRIYENNDPTKEVTSNYDIRFVDDYIRINIIKKRIDIYSGSDKKVFDGDVFDLYPDVLPNEWVDIDNLTAKQFDYTVTRYDDTIDGYIATMLDDDKIQVKKTIPSILEDSRNVGNHSNEFEWRVVDQNGQVKNDYYVVTEHPGTLEVKKLNINLYVNNLTKEYDSSNITFPNGQPIEGFDGYQQIVTEDSLSQGAELKYGTVYDIGGIDPTKIIPFNKTAFENNFKVVARIYKGVYSKFYLAGTYTFTVQAYIYDSDLDSIYNETDNVQLSFTESNLYYTVTKPSLTFRRTQITTTTELRLLIGTLKASDVLYFGTEMFTVQLGRMPRKWESLYDISNIHIYRDNNFDDEVTDCYNITLQ